MVDFLSVYETSRGGIPLFGTVHLLWLSAGILLLVPAAICYRRCGGQGRRRWLRGIALMQAAGEGGKYAVVIAAGCPDVQYLPLHLCSLCMFASAGNAVHPARDTEEFLFAVGLPAASAALLFPGWTDLPAGSYLSIHSFLFHILLLAAVLLPLSAGELRPDARRLPGCIGMLVCMLPTAAALNHRFRTNFFFLADPGAGNPLAPAARLWGTQGYVTLLILVCLCLWTVLYGADLLLRRAISSRSG